MKIFCLNKISPVALKTLKKEDSVVDNIADADSIIVRSQPMHDIKLENNVLSIARAGTGVNNIPISNYSEKGIVVFNTPGANSNSVKELVLCALFLASRDIIGANQWIKENIDDIDIRNLAEKNKNRFTGHEILNKTITIVGLGAIGIMVANSCVALGMKVRGYDPFINHNNANKLSGDVELYDKLEFAVSDVDFVSIHIPLNDSTKGLFNKNVLKHFRKTTLLNFSRDGIVEDDDLLWAIKNKKVEKYVTDFANPKNVRMPNTIVLPHLGASTEEAEDNCALMAINQLKNYIERGSIKNSVNYPDVDCSHKECEIRVCVLHRNIPCIINNITSIISSSNSNIVNFINKSKGEYAYSVFDVDGNVNADKIAKLDNIIRVRVL